MFSIISHAVLTCYLFNKFDDIRLHSGKAEWQLAKNEEKESTLFIKVYHVFSIPL